VLPNNGTQGSPTGGTAYPTGGYPVPTGTGISQPVTSTTSLSVITDNFPSPTLVFVPETTTVDDIAAIETVSEANQKREADANAKSSGKVKPTGRHHHPTGGYPHPTGTGISHPTGGPKPSGGFGGGPSSEQGGPQTFKTFVKTASKRYERPEPTYTLYNL
jgi:hypothetical protein